MIHLRAFRIVDAFAAGQAAEGAGVPMSENPFPPGTHEHTQWIIGYQWGSDAGQPPKRSTVACPVSLLRSMMERVFRRRR